MLCLRFKLILAVLLVFILSATTFSQTVIRVNCGGNEYWDHEGNMWSEDQPYTEGSWGYVNPGYFLYYDYPISGTDDDELYQYEHNALDSYLFTVPEGTFVVTLKFAELYYDNVGDRIFDVYIEDQLVLDNFDILAEADFAEALDKTFQIDVTDGILDIQFVTLEKEPGVTYAHANIKAISVVEQGTHEPKLWVNPHELDFYNFSNKQYFEVKNGGELPLDWNCFEDPDETWITNVEPTSGTLYQGQSERVYVYVSRSGLEDGEYQGKISITSNGGDDSVIVKMEVQSEIPIAEIHPSSLDYGAILTKRKFSIENVGTAQLDWTARNQNDDPWIVDISATGGSLAPGEKKEITVTVDRTDLTDATYQGIIAVETNGGDKDIKINLETTNKPLRVNCGGSQYVDNNENDWFYDLGFTGGQKTQSDENIANTDDDQLYQDARVGMSQYRFSVQKNGFYRIILHFAELEYHAAGERIFDVTIEDSLVLDNFDIYAENGSNYAVIKSADIEVTDQQIDIFFTDQAGSPCIAAIEIHQIPWLELTAGALDFGSIITTRSFVVKNPGTAELNWSANDQANPSWLREISPAQGVLAAADTQLVTVTVDRAGLADSSYQGNITVESNADSQNISLLLDKRNQPLRINCGGNDYLDADSSRWLSDFAFEGGRVISSTDSIANTDDDQLFQTALVGMTGYEFPLQQNGLYKITLYFAELQPLSVGERVFDVQIEDSVVLKNFDITAEAGNHSAVTRVAYIDVNDQQLDITFIPGSGEACVSGIEIFHSPVAAIRPAVLKFGSMLTRRHFTLANAGNVNLNWSVEDENNQPWLKEIAPIQGTLAPGDTQLVMVAVDRQQLADSSYQGELTIKTEGETRYVSVMLETKREPLRINCGGGEFIDAAANFWFEDLAFNGGVAISSPDSIANTSDDALYRVARSGMTGWELR